MLRITTETKRGKTIFSLEGRLAGPWVAALEQCWRELSGSTPRQKFSIDLCGVSFIDAAGKMLLKDMHSQGGEFIAEGCLNQAIVKEIIESTEKQEPEGGKGRKGSKGSPIIFYIALLSLLTGALRASAQDKPPLPANPPGETLRLTLEQSVALALKQNPTQQIAILNAAESVQDKNITRADLLPQADFRVADSASRVNIRAQFGGM